MNISIFFVEGLYMDMPKDPIMLMSYINTQLRDNYGSLTDLVKSYGANEAEIISKLEAVGYHYDSERNQFVR